jgi:hypothetical protein
VRRKDRIQHYIRPDLRQKIRASAAALGVTESSITEAALDEYFDRERTDKDWLLRRFDVTVEAISRIQSTADEAGARVQSEVDLLSDAFGVFVRRVFLPAVNSPGPDKEQRVEAAYQGFLRLLRDQNRERGKFSREVRGAGSASAGGAPGPPIGGR